MRVRHLAQKRKLNRKNTEMNVARIEFQGYNNQQIKRSDARTATTAGHQGIHKGGTS